jgi:hypothetical protein
MDIHWDGSSEDNGIAFAGDFVIAAWASATAPAGPPAVQRLGVFPSILNIKDISTPVGERCFQNGDCCSDSGGPVSPCLLAQPALARPCAVASTTSAAVACALFTGRPRPAMAVACQESHATRHGTVAKMAGIVDSVSECHVAPRFVEARVRLEGLDQGAGVANAVFGVRSI